MAALQNRTPEEIVVIKHFEFKLPNVLPEDLNDKANALLNREPDLVWAPELHYECMQKLIACHLGPPNYNLTKDEGMTIMPLWK